MVLPKLAPPVQGLAAWKFPAPQLLRPTRDQEKPEATVSFSLTNCLRQYFVTVRKMIRQRGSLICSQIDNYADVGDRTVYVRCISIWFLFSQ